MSAPILTPKTAHLEDRVAVLLWDLMQKELGPVAQELASP